MSLSIKTTEKQLFAAAGLAAALTFLAYIPALSNSFINWDDPAYVYSNEKIRNLNLSYLLWVFTNPSVANWHPLTMLSHAIDYAVWGLDPFGHHLGNIILHSLNTFLVAMLGYRLIEFRFGKNSRAVFATLVTALFFGLHPLHVESVAWVAERKDVLSMLFSLLAINSYISYASASKRSGYAFSLIFFILALMSKPMAVSLPLVLLIIDFFPLERFRQGFIRPVVEKIPFFIFSGVSSLLTIWAQKAGGAISTLETYPITVRLWGAVKAYVFYLYKTIAPIHLSPYYPHPVNINPVSIEYLGSLIVFIGITVFCAVTFKKYKAFTAAWLFYVITLIPVVGIVQVGGQAAADRYTYLPMLSIFLLAGAGAGYLFNSRTKMIITIAAACVFVVFGALTIKQLSVWKDPLTFWSYVLEENPETALAYINRAMAYEDVGRLDEALIDYTKSLELKPRAGTYNNRARIYHAKGDYQKAIEDFNRAIAMNPSFAEAYNNRGLTYRALGDSGGALADFATALKINPRLGAAYNNISIVYSDIGDFQASAAARLKATELGY